MNPVQLKKKQRLECEFYKNDPMFENFNDEEQDLILAIALGDFKLKLEKNVIRNPVKQELWKAAMRETGNSHAGDCMEAKNILQYDRFGSSKKKKRKNYLIQLGDDVINEIYRWETFGVDIKDWQEHRGIRIAKNIN
jgi:hypothetical protein